MHGTGSGRGEQHPALVFVQHPGRLLGRAVADRIGTESGGRQQFRRQRQYLAQQGIIWVAPAHARDESARHPQGECPACVPGGRQPLGAEPEHIEQFGRVGDRLPQGGLPVGHLPRAFSSGYHSAPILPESRSARSASR